MYHLDCGSFILYEGLFFGTCDMYLFETSLLYLFYKPPTGTPRQSSWYNRDVLQDLVLPCGTFLETSYRYLLSIMVPPTTKEVPSLSRHRRMPKWREVCLKEKEVRKEEEEKKKKVLTCWCLEGKEQTSISREQWQHKSICHYAAIVTH